MAGTYSLDVLVVLVEYVIVAFAVTLDPIITSPKEQMRLAVVVLYLKVVDIAILFFGRPDEITTGDVSDCDGRR